MHIKIGDYAIDNSECKKLLSVKINFDLTFNNHVSDLCKINNRNISPSAKVTTFMKLGKRRLLMNASFNPPFTYCPRNLTCHSRANNKKN